MISLSITNRQHAIQLSLSINQSFSNLNVPQHIFEAQTFAQTFALPVDSEGLVDRLIYANLCSDEIHNTNHNTLG